MVDCETELTYIDQHLQFYRYEEYGEDTTSCGNFCSYNYVLAYTVNDQIDKGLNMYHNHQFPNCKFPFPRCEALQNPAQNKLWIS